MNKYSERFKSEKKKYHYSEILKAPVLRDSKSEESLVSDRSKIVSKCTVRQKEIMSTVQRLESSPSLETIKSVYSSPVFKKDRNFDKLISQLDAVIFSNSAQKIVVLNEEVPYHSLLYEGCTQYFRIDVLGRQCPLQVNVTRKQGVVKILYAKNKADPSEHSYDCLVKKDAFRVSDSSLKFKSEFVGISVTAVTDVDFSIAIQFGSRKFLPWMSETHWSTTNNSKKQAPQSERSDRCKNFIELNMNPVPLNSPKGLHLIKFKDWKTRRDQVMVRKRTNLQAKRNKTIMALNKNTTTKEEQCRQRIKTQIDSTNADRQKLWLKFIALGKVLNSISRVLKEENENLGGKTHGLFRTPDGMSSADSNLCTSGDLLSISTLACNKLMTKSLEKKTVEFIIASKSVFEPRIKVQSLISKVVVIQRAWGKYYDVHMDRIKLLCQIWNTVFEKIERNTIFKNTKCEIAYLTKKDKIRVFNDYLKQKKTEYLEQVKEYYEKGLYNKQTYPGFKYVPEKAEMKDIIYKASHKI